jgi:hypothetical protein
MIVELARRTARQDQARKSGTSDGAGNDSSRSSHLNEVNEARACLGRRRMCHQALKVIDEKGSG